jgi:hypothetical protein
VEEVIVSDTFDSNNPPKANEEVEPTDEDITAAAEFFGAVTSSVQQLEFGDLPGHDFRGNQWTGPRFGDSVQPQIGFLTQGKADFTSTHGMGIPAAKDWAKIAADPVRGTRIAHDYDALPMRDDAAIPAYDALRTEVGQQYDYLTNKLGVKVEAVDQDPYKNVKEMRDDVADNHHLAVLSTDSTGPHPYLSNEENDQFRAVHDAFGHAAIGRGFDRNGEEAAFQSHAQMFSPLATRALASETRGQNSELIYGEHAGSFPPQKFALLPEADSLVASSGRLLDADDDNLYSVTHCHHVSLGRSLHMRDALVAALEFGDTAGHAFHGNQYTKVDSGLSEEDKAQDAKEDADMAYAAHQATVHEALEDWTHNGEAARAIRHDAEDMVLNQERHPGEAGQDRWGQHIDPGTTHRYAAVLMQEASSAPPTEMPLYRGYAVGDSLDGAKEQFPIGGTVTFPLAAFSENTTTSDRFAEWSYERYQTGGEKAKSEESPLSPVHTDATMVDFSIDSGAHAVSTQQSAGGFWDDEKEHIVTGDYKIVGTSEVDKPPYYGADDVKQTHLAVKLEPV